MRRLPSWGWVAGIVVVAVLCGGGFGWWFSHRNAPDLNFDPANIPSSTEVPPASQTQRATAPPAETAKPANETTPPEEPMVAEKPDPAEPPVTADQKWQDELDEVLLSDTNDEQKVARL